MEGGNGGCAVMQGEPFTSYGVEECWVDECRSRNVPWVERCDPGLPKMFEKLTGGFRGLVKIWTRRATWILVGPLAVSSGLCSSDTRKYHLLQPLLPSGRKFACLGIELPVTTKLDKGVHVAHAKELGVL